MPKVVQRKRQRHSIPSVLQSAVGYYNSYGSYAEAAGNRIGRAYRAYDARRRRVPAMSVLQRRRAYTQAARARVSPPPAWHPPMSPAYNSRPKPSTGTANMWNTGGKVTTSFPKLTKGRQGTAKGKMAVLVGKRRIAKMNKEYPHSVFTKYWLCKPNINLQTGSIGFVDKLYSVSSKSEQYLSYMYVDLNKYASHWSQEPIGNHALPAAQSPLHVSNATNDANLPTASMITQSRIPNSSQPGEAVYHCPTHYSRSLRVKLRIGNASCPQQQTLTIKLCRMNLAEPQSTNVLSSPHVRELVNQANITSDRTFETVWQHSFTLAARNTQNTATYRDHIIDKHITYAYLRSVCRKVASLESETDFGHMQKPHFKYADSNPTDTSFVLFNNLYLVISAKLKSKYFSSAVQHINTTTIPNPAAPAGSMNTIGTSEYRSEENQMTPTTSDAQWSNGFARFTVCGNVTIENRVHDFARSA